MFKGLTDQDGRRTLGRVGGRNEEFLRSRLERGLNMCKGVVASLLAVISVVGASAQPSRWAEAVKRGRELQTAYHFVEAQDQFQEALTAAEKLPNSARMQAIALYDLATAAEDLGNTDVAAKLYINTSSPKARTP
jgi:hypothetical protein